MSQAQVTRANGELRFAWPDLPIKVALSRIHDGSRDTTAEMQVQYVNGSAKPTILLHQSLNLLTSKTRLAKELNARHAAPWPSMLEQVCVLTLRELRKGEPVVVLQPQTEANVPFLLNPLVYQRHQTLIYAPGGSCKSYLALYLSLLACHGASQHGLSALPCPVLYLDWELDEETVGTRLGRLYRGHPELSEFAPYYRRCHQPIHEDLEVLRTEIEEKAIRLLIVDSALMACADDMNSTEAPKRLSRALRQLGCASIVLSHVAKHGEQKTAYGNVFFQNLCRNQYEAELVDETELVKRIVLTHRKVNFGPFKQPIGFAFAFQDDACRVSAFDPGEEEDQAEEHLPLPAQIRNLLADGMPRMAKEIAETLHQKHDSIRTILNRHDRKKWCKISSGQWTMTGAK